MSKKDFRDQAKVEAPNFLKQVHGKGDPEKKPKYKVTSFRVREDLIELLNRAAYHNQVGQKEILEVGESLSGKLLISSIEPGASVAEKPSRSKTFRGRAISQRIRPVAWSPM